MQIPYRSYTNAMQILYKSYTFPFPTHTNPPQTLIKSYTKSIQIPLHPHPNPKQILFMPYTNSTTYHSAHPSASHRLAPPRTPLQVTSFN